MHEYKELQLGQVTVFDPSPSQGRAYLLTNGQAASVYRLCET